MKKTLTVIVAAFMLFMLIGCSEPKEQVDEEDMSRWIVEFISDEDSDLENGRLEMTVEELIKKWKSGEPLKISFQWYDKFISIGDADFGYTLEPELMLYYVNDAGERIENGALNNDKYYLLIENKYKVHDGKNNSVARVLAPGLYEVVYHITKNQPEDCVPPYIGETIIVNYYVGNINEEEK